MTRVMQHRDSRMFLTATGKLSPWVWDACRFENITSAVKQCQWFKLTPSEFLFRVFEDNGRSQLGINGAGFRDLRF